MKPFGILVPSLLFLAVMQSSVGAVDSTPAPSTPSAPPASSTQGPGGTVMDSSGPFEPTEPVDSLPPPEEPVELTEEMMSREVWDKLTPYTGLYPYEIIDPEQNLGEPDSESCAGNPISAATGNKFQEETDIPIKGQNRLGFGRYYNSQRSVRWTHSYSIYIKMIGKHINLYNSNGGKLQFAISADGNSARPSGPSGEKLQKVAGGWEYQNENNEAWRFNSTGKAVQWRNGTGYSYVLDYTGKVTTITDIYDNKLRLEHDYYGRLSKVTNAYVVVSYGYDKAGRLIEVASDYSGTLKTRHYLYEDSRLPFHLTGLIDERGVRFATWAYDARGRAILSEHANGADRTEFMYDDLGFTTIVNPLGKKTVQKFRVINNVKKLAGVDGQTSANCMMSNSSISYDSQGNISERVNELGTKTVYSYSQQGLEVSRTEAYGTPFARTIITQRDSLGGRPIKIEEPGKVTSFRYSPKGQLIEMTVSEF